MTKKDHIRDDGQVGKYFTMLYNMADDDLNPYQYRLLGHYKRVCGETDDGACWESTRTTAKKCKISVGKIASTRRELEAMRYVSIEERGDDTLRITMIDRMAENVARYVKRSSGEQGVHQVNANVHTVNASVHEVKQRITTEEKPSKNNHDKKERAPNSANPSPKPPKKLVYPPNIKKWGWDHLKQYEDENPDIKTLVCFDEMKVNFKELTTTAAQDLAELHKELIRLSVLPGRWDSLRLVAEKNTYKATIFKRMFWAIENWMKSEAQITVVSPVPDQTPGVKPTRVMVGTEWVDADELRRRKGIAS